ncbi:hypothetical protein RHMOL_Rhmol04G0215100 [Rhododendron molle]|uniref:Uncharacterized protein n=1 Tax=Rhododendron molle TaxID=49168 RepID=A0ACC0P412_RHOML|nr:hypothetical protein RHMOL_Rhmol04G0215100 [Rhododendron molle]
MVGVRPALEAVEPWVLILGRRGLYRGARREAKGLLLRGKRPQRFQLHIGAVDVLFRLAATSSSHIPITKYDVAEHLPDKALAKLLEDNPMIGEIVLKAKEDRAWGIAAAEAAEWANREQKEREELLRDAEAEERAGA